MPFFSICIPQYNRTSFLIEACRRLAGQTFRDYELCIADDCSTDGRTAELEQKIRQLGIPYVLHRQSKNLRYDGNLRSAISLASGMYCLLMGNDDCLAEDTTLEELHSALVNQPNAGVVISNYGEYESGRLYRRTVREGIAGSGPAIAVSRFRNFSFISGIVLRTGRAQSLATDRWDGSEMYQMYIGSRIIAEGYDLLELERVTVLMGITMPGESVDSYASKRLQECHIMERKIPLVEMGRLVYDAIRPYAGGQAYRLGTSIFLQIVLFTYPFWIVEYRRVQSWQFAIGICLGMRPRNLLRDVSLPLHRHLLVQLAYCSVTFAGFAVPVSVFDRCRSTLYRLAKSVR